MARTVGRLALGVFLVVAGIGHVVATESFLAQVPPWMPAPRATVLVSGAIEVALGVALLFDRSRAVLLGWLTAGLFVAVFPGNVSQYLTGTDAFGLDSDAARATRLLFQPLLVAWALWATGAWRAWRDPATDAIGRPRDGAPG